MITCGVNLGQDGYYAPCIRPKGHKGPHKHKEYCNDAHCSCRGLLKRMTQADRNMYFSLCADIKIYQKKITRILKKYHRRPR